MRKITEQMPVIVVSVINVAMLATLFVNLSQAFRPPVM